MTYTRVGVDGRAVDVQVLLRQDLRALVDGTTRTIEDTTQHVLGHTELQAVAGELDFGLQPLAHASHARRGTYLLDIDARGTFKHLPNVSRTQTKRHSILLPEQRRGCLSPMSAVIQPCGCVSVCHTSRLQNLTRPLGAIGQRQRNDFVEPREFDLDAGTSAPSLGRGWWQASTDILENNQWTVHTADGVVTYPRLDGHHAGIDGFGGHGCGGGHDRVGGYREVAEREEW